MSGPITLVDARGAAVFFKENGSGNIKATFYDNDEVAIPKVALVTLLVTLYSNVAPYTPINGRNAQSVKDANGGTVADSGELILRLQPLDNVTAGTSESEEHIARFVFTWVDSSGLTRTGIEEISFRVRNLVTIAA